MRKGLFLVAGLLLLGASAAAQQPYRAPRTSFGAPDLQGGWTNDTQTPLERPTMFGARLTLTPKEAEDLERAGSIARGPLFGGFGNFTDPDSFNRVMRVNGEARTSLITSTPDGRIPAPRPLPVNAPVDSTGPGQNADPETRSLDERCIKGPFNVNGPVMLPSLYNNNYRIVQSRDAVAIEVEMVHDVRVVRLGAQHRADGVRPWFGDSIGWWEGDTLVVETTNFPERQHIRGAWRDLKVTERFTRTREDALLYRFTVEAPERWAAAWGGEYEFKPSRGPLIEYACHEGNYTLGGILAGARYEQGDFAAAGRPDGRVP